MKKLYSIILAVIITLSAAAQLPSQIANVLGTKAGKKTDTVYTTWYLLDSIVEKNYDFSSNTLAITGKNTYLYDGKYHIEVQYWNVDTATGNYVLTYKMLLTRDTLHRIVTTTSYSLSGSNLVPTYKDSTIYDGSTETKLQVYSFRYDTTTSQWTKSSLTTYTYDNNNNLTEELSQVWDNLTSSWVNSWKEVHTYTNGLETQIERLQWNTSTSQWSPSTKTTKAYDNNNNLVEEIKYTADASGNYVPMEKQVWQYDNNNLKIAEARYQWSTAQNMWFNQDSTIHIYVNSMPARDTVFKGDTTAWVYDRLNIYTIDSNNQLTGMLQKKWTAGQWIDNIKYTITYENYDINQVVYPEGNLEGINAPVSQLSIYLWMSTSWQEIMSQTYYYSSYTEWRLSNIQDVIVNKIKIYPNPAVDYITVDLQGTYHLSIYDLGGKLVLQRMADSSRIHISNLKPGIYILKIKQNGTTKSSIFIKQ